MYAISGHAGHVCVKETVGQYEISISFDYSCGAFDTMRRADIRVYRVEEGGTGDVTDQVFGLPSRITVVIGSMENLMVAYQWAKERTE